MLSQAVVTVPIASKPHRQAVVTVSLWISSVLSSRLIVASHCSVMSICYALLQVAFC